MQVLPPITEPGIFSVVYTVGSGISFKELCCDVLRISETGEGPYRPGTAERVAPKWKRVQGILRKLSAEKLVAGKPAWHPTEVVVDPERISDVLLTAPLDDVPAEATIAAWLPWDRAEALLWAWHPERPRPAILASY